MAYRKTEGPHGPECKCAACVRRHAVEQGAQRQRERMAATLRKASRSQWVDIHGVGMRRI